jgi:hypothetical protein
MYRNIGDHVLVREQEIVGVFDLDITSQSLRTRQYLNRAEQSGQVVYTNINEIPKSFVLCAPKKRGSQRVYISTLNSRTVAGRLERGESL